MTCTLCGENCWPPCWRTWDPQTLRSHQISFLSFPDKSLNDDWVIQPSDVYLDNTHLASRQLHAYCSRVAGSEASLPRFYKKLRGW